MSSSYWFPAFGEDAGRFLIQEASDRDEAQTQMGKNDTKDPLKSFSIIFWTLISALTFCAFQHWRSTHPWWCFHSQNTDLGGWVMSMGGNPWAGRLFTVNGCSNLQFFHMEIMGWQLLLLQGEGSQRAWDTLPILYLRFPQSSRCSQPRQPGQTAQKWVEHFEFSL